MYSASSSTEPSGRPGRSGKAVKIPVAPVSVGEAPQNPKAPLAHALCFAQHFHASVVRQSSCFQEAWKKASPHKAAKPGNTTMLYDGLRETRVSGARTIDLSGTSELISHHWPKADYEGALTDNTNSRPLHLRCKSIIPLRFGWHWWRAR